MLHLFIHFALSQRANAAAKSCAFPSHHYPSPFSKSGNIYLPSILVCVNFHLEFALRGMWVIVWYVFVRLYFFVILCLLNECSPIAQP